MPETFDMKELDELLSGADDENINEQKETTSESNVNKQETKEPRIDKQEQDITNTKAFATRLKESNQKAIFEERENIAISMGYASYAEMLKKQEAKVIEDKGLNPDDVSPVIDSLLEKRLANDPRMSELTEFRKHKVEEFAKKELEEISKLTDGQVTTMEQIPKEVLELWKTTGSLKKAYIQLEGERLILKNKIIASKATSTEHMKNPSQIIGADRAEGKPLTKKQREMYLFFNPNMTDKELDEIRTKGE